MKTRLVIADDHKIVRDGLVALVHTVPSLEVVGEAESGRAALEQARQLRPDVVVMDIAMPDLNGVDATRQILAEVSDVRVVALSMHSDRRYVTGMLEAGASGYLVKDSAFEELARCVETVMQGRTYLSPRIAGIVVDDYVQRLSPEERSQTLSPREREVLQLLAEGWSTKQVAGRLNVSVKTIESHRKRIMDKLDLHSIAELTKYAIREGLTALEP